MRLSHILAAVKAAKSESARALADLTRRDARAYNGMWRQYEPATEDGVRLPDESVLVQYSAQDTLAALWPSQAGLLDAVLNQEEADQAAVGDLVVHDSILARSLPVTYLLWLDKWLGEVEQVVRAIPVLDPAQRWEPDSTEFGMYSAPVVRTARREKTMQVITKFAGNAQHPPQTELVPAEVVTGYWSQRSVSGALPRASRDALLSRVATLRAAVAQAREDANSTEIEPRHISAAILGYLADGPAQAPASSAR